MKRFILLLVLLTLTVLTACKDKETDEEMVCPGCGSADVVPIIYGEPDRELFDAADRGEVVLGGCLIYDEAPNWYCEDCGMEWQ